MSVDAARVRVDFAAVEEGIRATGHSDHGSRVRYEAQAALRRIKEQLEAAQEALRAIEIRGEQGGRLCDTSHGMWRIAHEALNPAKERP